MNQEIITDLFSNFRETKSSFTKFEEKDGFSKNYTSKDERIVIRNSTSGEILINASLLTPKENVVPVGNDVMFAKIKLDDFSNVSKNIFDSTRFIDMNKNETTVKNITFKYGIEYEVEACFNVDEGNICLNDTRINWTEFTNLRELPKNNIFIGLFTNTLYKEKIEWIPNIYGFEITEWASFSTSNSYAATFDAGGTEVNNTFDAGTGSNRFIIVAVTWSSSNSHTIDGVTYDGTTVVSLGAFVNQNNVRSQIFGVAAPSTGNNTLSVDPSTGVAGADAVISAWVANDINQTNSTDGYVTANAADAGAPFESTVTITSETDDIIFTVHSTEESRTVNSVTNFTQREETQNSVSQTIGDASGSTSVVTTTEWNNFINWIAIGVNLNNVAGDSESPRWFNNLTNSTLAGETINHSVNWTDDTALSSYIFSFHNGSNWTTQDNSGDRESGEFNITANFGGGAETITFYNFTDLTDNVAFNGTGQNADMLGGTELTSTGYTNINSNNNVYTTATSTANQQEPFMRFNFTINETIGDINWINVSFHGFEDASPESATVFVLNHTSGAFDITVGTVPTSDGTIELNITEAFTDVINVNAQFVFAARGSNFDSGESISVDFVEVTVNAGGGGSGDLEANRTGTQYLDVINGSVFELITNITVVINVSDYNNTGSVAAGNNNNTLYLGIFNGTEFLNFGDFGVGTTRLEQNYSITVTDQTVLSAWGTDANRDINISGVFFDGDSSDDIDQINWTDVWIIIGSEQVFLNDSAVSFTGTQNFSNVVKSVNTTVGTTIQWRVWANDSSGNENTTDIFTYVTTSGVDSCTYTSGDWVVDCSDNCVITSNEDLGGNDFIISGTGTFRLSGANITNYGRVRSDGTDSNNMCIARTENGGFID